VATEYAVDIWDLRATDGRPNTPKLVRHLREIGDEGWDLVSLTFNVDLADHGPAICSSSSGRPSRIGRSRALNQGGFEYTEYFDDDGTRMDVTEYYDLTADPWELTNLLGDGAPNDDPTGLDELHALLSAERACTGTSGPTPCP
jgi:hypothetical protein